MSPSRTVSTESPRASTICAAPSCITVPATRYGMGGATGAAGAAAAAACGGVFQDWAGKSGAAGLPIASRCGSAAKRPGACAGCAPVVRPSRAPGLAACCGSGIQTAAAAAAAQKTSQARSLFLGIGLPFRCDSLTQQCDSYTARSAVDTIEGAVRTETNSEVED